MTWPNFLISWTDLGQTLDNDPAKFCSSVITQKVMRQLAEYSRRAWLKCSLILTLFVENMLLLHFCIH